VIMSAVAEAEERRTSPLVGQTEKTGVVCDLDSLLDLERTFIQEGMDAAAVNKDVVDEDAYTIGKSHGDKCGAELGFITGAVSIFEAFLQFEATQPHICVPPSRGRVVRAIQNIKDQIKSLPLDNPSIENFVDRLDAIRLNYKKVRALMGLLENGTRATGGSVSLDF